VGELALLSRLLRDAAFKCAPESFRDAAGKEFQFFFVRWGKNKIQSVGQRVGLDAVLLQYGLYIFGHLSIWFVFVLMFKFWSVSRFWNGRPSIG